MPDDENMIADGMPMNLDQMREYLQEHHGVPIALREKGKTVIKCPHCQRLHDHGAQPGHHRALCDDKERDALGLVVGDRCFIPNYGYIIYKYKSSSGINKLIDRFRTT
jgi:hypothetical protein